MSEYPCYPGVLDLRNHLNVDAPRAKGAYVEDAPDEVWFNNEWVLEEKGDGLRLTMQLGPEKSLLQGRNRQDFLKGVEKAGPYRDLGYKNPALEMITNPSLAGTVIDGELTECVTKAGKPDRDTRRREANGDFVGFEVWDCLFYKYNDIRGLPLWKRREVLKGVVSILNTPKIRVTKQYAASKGVLDTFFERGIEGAIAKRLNDPIPIGQRTHTWWYKLKGDNRRTVDAFIIGVTEGVSGGSGVKGVKAKPSGKAASFTLAMVTDEGDIVEIGKLKNALTEEMVEYGIKDYKRFDKRVVELIVSGFDGKRFRWPRFKKWRSDKTPGDCRITEQIGRAN